MQKDYQQALKEVDKSMEEYQIRRKKELEANPDNMFGDVISDIWVLSIYKTIAAYAVKCNDKITVDGYLLSDIISKELYDEKGGDVDVYELLGEFMMLYGGYYTRSERVSPQTPPESVARLIKHFNDKMDKLF